MRRLGYVPALDGIRGVAIALVIGQHYWFHMRGPLTGATGVEIFFVLSGFLITTLLLEERDRTGSFDLRRFYVRRARRLFPALAILLVFYVAARHGRGLEQAALGGLYVGNIAMAWSPHLLALQSMAGLGHLWSLAQEEQFYAMWPAALLLLLRAKTGRLLPFLLAALLVYDVALAVSGADGNRLYFAPDTNMAWLVAGAALAFYRLRGRHISDMSAIAAIMVLAVLVAAIKTLPQLFVLQPVLVLCYAAIVGAAFSGGRVAAALSLTPLVWLGRVSYSLYLWHPPIYLAVGHRTAVALPLAVGAAWLSYRFVELPFRRRRSAPDRLRKPVNDEAASGFELAAAAHGE